MPFTSFCLFLSLSLSHSSLLLSFSLDFFFLFFSKIPSMQTSVSSVQGPTLAPHQGPVLRYLCHSVVIPFLFLANFQPASTSHLHSNDTAKETLAKAASSVQVFTAAWRKIAASDLGRLERFDQWSLFLQNFGAQLQFYLSRGKAVTRSPTLCFYSPDLLVLKKFRLATNRSSFSHQSLEPNSDWVLSWRSREDFPRHFPPKTSFINRSAVLIQSACCYYEINLAFNTVNTSENHKWCDAISEMAQTRTRAHGEKMPGQGMRVSASGCKQRVKSDHSSRRSKFFFQSDLWCQSCFAVSLARKR